MAKIRVSELAIELDIPVQEIIQKFAEIGVEVKSHISKVDDEAISKLKESFNSSQEDAEAIKEQEDLAAQRLEAVRKERAKREKEKAQLRGSYYDGVGTAETTKSKSNAAESVGEKLAEESEKAAKLEPEKATKAKKEAPVKPTKKQAESTLGVLESQISNAKKLAEEEKKRKAAEAAAKKAAADVAKRQAVAAGLNKNKQSTKKAPRPESATAVEPKSSPKAPVAKPDKKEFDSLLSQISSEKERISTDVANKKATEKNQAKPKSSRRVKVDNSNIDIDLGLMPKEENSSEDRYAQMAHRAEKLQKDKVLAEARAAVAAAVGSEGEGRRKKRKEKREAENRERLENEAIERGLDPTIVLDKSTVEIPQGASVSKFAELLGIGSNEIVKRLFLLGQALTLTQTISDDLMELIADDLGRTIRVVSPEEEYMVVYNDKEEDLVPRPPVVTVMGHVDHGKTSLLDAIRQTGVVHGEAGGITQHIGASVAHIEDRQITFIDTPGHEAFTAMRARGAQITDVIVLVVAADDGVMPQTIEAINHAKAADVPIVVAVNKIDKPGANPDRVRQELTEHGVIPEEWGGTNMFVEVSAKQELNIDDLLETILLQADVLGLTANPNALASGFVIEANLDKGRGPVATVLVQRGTLRSGDTIVAGTSYGRVRALVDPHGNMVSDVLPAGPVEVLGLSSVPTAGDEFRVFEDERDARKLAEERSFRERLSQQESRSAMTLDDLFDRIEEGKTTDLNLIVKADVQGSIEALRDAFLKIDQSEVKINIVHSAVGGITETDVTLASASDAIIIVFNVRPTGKTKSVAEKEKVDIRLYRVIYQAIEDINSARVGLLSPDIVEEDTGIAEVRDTFKVPKAGTVAGSYIVDGEISRDDKVRVVRDGTVIFEGEIDSLRRFKDDVKSVRSGYECGISVVGYQDIKVGDTIEAYKVVEVARSV